MAIVILQLTNEKHQEAALSLIAQFWWAHNQEQVADELVLEDYRVWTSQGHLLYLVSYDSEFIGFAHLTARGGAIDWLEDLFIQPACQRQGLGSQVFTLLEEEVAAYSESLYIEVAARNLQALRLYASLGYDCLNTLTIRKDFHPEIFDSIQTTSIVGHDFAIRRYKEMGKEKN